jgi:antirestriction protein
MDSNGTDPANTAEQIQAIKATIRELAYGAWAYYRRELDQDTDRSLFERAYMGHYSSIDSYVIQLVDDYNLDAKLDRLIAEPFRRHVDIDITAFGRALVSSATIYTLLAVPVGVWVFIEV